MVKTEKELFRMIEKFDKMRREVALYEEELAAHVRAFGALEGCRGMRIDSMRARLWTKRYQEEQRAALATKEQVA